MKEFIDKLIGRLEEYPHGKYEDEYGKGFSAGINASIEEVNELAEEYINTSTDISTDTSSGWIPCSEELPEEDKIVLLCTKDKLVRQGVRHISYEHNRYDLYGVTSTFWDEDIVAWQPLPKPYKE